MAINGIKHNLPPASVRWGDQVDKQLATLGNKTNNTNKNIRGSITPSATYIPVPVPGQGFRVLTSADGDTLTWDSTTTYQIGDIVLHPEFRGAYIASTTVNTNGNLPNWNSSSPDSDFIFFTFPQTVYLGNWNYMYSNYTYNDVVTHKGSTWIFQNYSGNEEPGTGSAWALVASGAIVNSTSATSLTVGTGTKTFVTGVPLSIDIGSRLHLARTSDPNNIYLEGTVTAISGTSVTINSDLTLGSGTYTDWTVTLTGARGPQGIQGPPGTDSTTPTGSVTMFAGGFGSIPSGWLLCDGSATSRTGATATLFSVIGTAYGAGDGTTTFNIPDFQVRFPIGTDTIGMPAGSTGGVSSHNHMLSDQGYAQIGVFGSDVAGKHVNPVPAWTQDAVTAGSGGSTADRTKGAALRGHTDNTTTLPPYLAINFIIKT